MTSTGRPVTARLAFVLLWLFVFSIPMAQATEFPIIGTVSHAVWLAGIVIGVVAVVRRRRMRLLGPLHLAMAAFILWSTVTMSWSVAPELTAQHVATYLQLFVLVLLLWEMCVEEKDVLRLLGAFVLGAMVPALSTLYGFLPGRQTLIERASAPGYDANQVAFLLALSLPAAYFLILRETGPIISLYRLQMGFAVCAILLTGSPNAMIAMAVGLSMACWTRPKLSPAGRTLICFIVPLLGAIALLVVPANMWKGVAEKVRNGDLTVTLVMDRELESMRATPLGGFGAGTQDKPVVAVSYGLGGRPASFTIFAETGVVGIACFVTLLGLLVAAAARMSTISKSFWLTSLAVWMVGALSLSWECSPSAWLIFGLLAAHSACLNPRNQPKSIHTSSWTGRPRSLCDPQVA